MSKKDEMTDMIENDFAEGSETDETSLSKRGIEGGWGMQPANMSEGMKLCKFLAESNVIPNAYKGKPSDIFVCIQHGQEIGLKPLQSLNSIAVVNGRPTVDNSTFLALARQHPDWEWIKEDNQGFAYARDHVSGWEHLKDVDPDTTSICVVKRKGEDPVVREFSNEDVKRAGLGNVHKTYPKDMRKYRARQRALEPTFGEVLKGFKMTEVERENVQVYGEDYEGDTQDAEVIEERKAAVGESIKKNMQKKRGATPPNSDSKTSKSEEVDEDTTEATSTQQDNEELPEERKSVASSLPVDEETQQKDLLQTEITGKAKKVTEDDSGKFAWVNLIKEKCLSLTDGKHDKLTDLSIEQLKQINTSFDE